jgi:hypothetical protein
VAGPKSVRRASRARPQALGEQSELRARRDTIAIPKVPTIHRPFAGTLLD